MSGISTKNVSFALGDQYNKQINTIIELTKVAETNIQHISNTTNTFNIQLNQAASAAKGVNDELNKTKGSAGVFDTIKNKLGSLISLQDIAQKGFDMVGKGLGIASELQKSEQSFGRLVGNAQAGKGLFNHIAKQSRTSSLSLEDMAANTQGFLGVTRNVQDIDKLNNMSERLGTLNTTGQDAKGAGSALQKAMSGDFTSLTKGFNIDEGSIKSSGLEQAVNMGDTTKAVGILDTLINKAGYSQSALDGMTGNLSSQWELFTSKMTTDFGLSMRVVANTFAPIIMKFNELRESGFFQPFIDAFVTGVNVIAMGLSGIINGFIWLGEVISANWDIVSAVLGGIAGGLMILGATYLPMLIAKLWEMLVPMIAQIPVLLTQAAAWIMMNLPILMVMAAIAGIIFILGQMGVTFEQVFAFVGGLIGVIVGVILNYVTFTWNLIAAFANFFANVLKNPMAAVEKLFYDLAVNALGFIESIAKGIQDMLNSIPGVKVDITSGISNIKDNLATKASQIADKNQFDEAVKQADFMNLLKAGGMGAESGKNVLSDLKKLTPSGGLGDKFNLSSLPNTNKMMPNNNPGVSALTGNSAVPISGPNGGSVPVSGTSGGNIPVDVSEEDVQYLKDIAERDYINKYSAATLAPNIQVQFGDIRETADANQVAKRIQYILQEQIAVAAEGAY